jgi:mitochondrial pyruvate carrier 2
MDERGWGQDGAFLVSISTFEARSGAWDADRSRYLRAPVMKWGLVLAGVSDFFRPTEKLSLTQNLALTATGSIWTRWCLIIKPKNYLYVPAYITSHRSSPNVLHHPGH